MIEDCNKKSMTALMEDHTNCLRLPREKWKREIEDERRSSVESL